MSRVAAQRELTARYRSALSAYHSLPGPLLIEQRRYCDHVVEAMGPITWCDSGTRESVILDVDEAYRAATAEYERGV